MVQEAAILKEKREQGALARMVAELNAEHDQDVKREGLLPRVQSVVKHYRTNELAITRGMGGLAGLPVDKDDGAVIDELESKYADLAGFIDEYPHTPAHLRQLAEFSTAAEFAKKIYSIYPDLLNLVDEDDFLVSGAYAYRVEIKGQRTGSGETRFILHNGGIDKVVEKLVDGALQEVYDPLWVWEDFRIHDVIRERTGDEIIYYFKYTYNGDIYANKTLEEMRDEIYTTAGRSLGIAKQIFGPLVQAYCHNYIPSVGEYETRCGFTRERGWILPDTHHIRFLHGQQSKCKPGLMRMSKMNIHEHEAREMMQGLYGGVSLRHRDVIFAWGAIAPFFHALVDHSGIMPILSLGSLIGTTGKTPAAELVTSLLWDNIPHKYISTDEFNSEARAQQYLSASTFPVCVDECADLSDRLTQLIKSHATGEQDYSRLTHKSKIAFDRPLTSPLVLTWNTPPILMEDYNFLARTVHVPVDELPSNADRERFIRARAGVTRGYLGKYIYEKTRAMTVEDLIPRLEAWDWLEAPSTRAGMIYKLLALGGELFHEWFGITLNLGYVKRLIHETQAMHGTDLRANIIAQFVDGRDDKLIKVWDADSKCYEEIPDFKPQRKWISTPVHSISSRAHDGYIYTQDNLADLKRRADMKGLALKTLHETVKQMYPRAQYKPIRFEGQTLTVIYVPRDDVFPPACRAQTSLIAEPVIGVWSDFVTRDGVEGPPLDVYNVVEDLYRASGYKPVHTDAIKDLVELRGVGEADVAGILAALRDNSWVDLTPDGYKILRNIIAREGL